MENERNLSMTKRSLLKSIVGDTSMNSRNASIQDLSDYHIVEILVRLPVKTIVHCKCVCRDWLNLITDSHFINLHLAKSHETFMILDDKYTNTRVPKAKSTSLRLMEILEEDGRNYLHHDPIMSLNLNLAPVFRNVRLFAEGSVNGLICLSGSDRQNKIYICNPITREYMILPKQINNTKAIVMKSYGFGVSSLTGEYKVIRLFQYIRLSLCVLYADIYTLGTGIWRRLGYVTYSIYDRSGVFLNNHIHWNIRYHEDPHKNILTFDIDNETFDLFPSPPVGLEEDSCINRILGVLKGCLFCSYYNIFSGEFIIWVMKEYGINNSWQKEVLISVSILPNLGWEPFVLFPKGSLKDGSILILYDEGKLLVYYPDTCTTKETDFSKVDAISYRPSFVKLQNFESESVHKFPR